MAWEYTLSIGRSSGCGPNNVPNTKVPDFTVHSVSKEGEWMTMILNLRYTLSIEQLHSKVVIPFARWIGIWISEWDRNQLSFNLFPLRHKRRDALFTSLCCSDYKVFTQIELSDVVTRWISVITVHFIALCIQIAKVDSHNEHFQDRCSSYMYGIRLVRIHLTTRESGTKHSDIGQAIRKGFIEEFVFTE